MTREQRLVFGEVAELYDSVRPAYPATLIDDVVAFVGSQAWARMRGVALAKPLCCWLSASCAALGSTLTQPWLASRAATVLDIRIGASTSAISSAGSQIQTQRPSIWW